jgi:hypothetical protein
MSRVQKAMIDIAACFAAGAAFMLIVLAGLGDAI